MTGRQVKVLFVLPRMVGGGIERMRLVLVRHFIGEGMDCMLALRHCRGELIDDARALLPVVELAPRGMHQFIPSLKRLIERENPTHVITAFADVGVLAWCAMRLAKSKAAWVHSVHLTHEGIAARPGIRGWLRHRLEQVAARFVFKRADRIVAVSDGLVREITEMTRPCRGRVTRIYNPVVPDIELRPRDGINRERGRCFRIIAIGRLAREKGFDVLIEAMQAVPQPWRLEIYGEGPERSGIEALIREAGLVENVTLMGFSGSPFRMLRSADLFVLPSRYEGFGNVVVEAMACQCQIVATDCPVGPSEILQEGRFGQLVPVEDTSSLADAICAAIDRRYFVAPEKLLQRAAEFSCSEGCRQWAALIRDLPQAGPDPG